MQIPGVGKVLGAGGIVAQHPAHMGEPQAALGGVGVQLDIVDMAVVAAMNVILMVTMTNVMLMTKVTTIVVIMTPVMLVMMPQADVGI